MSEELEELFPGLASDGYAITSPETAAYNCVAWAVGEAERWWQPGFYWPAPTGDDLAALIAVFVSIGYAPCDDDGFEFGYEKVALYADDRGEWTHVARQLSDGWWTSKLGQSFDIRHRSPRTLVGVAYGDVRALLRRVRV